MGARIQWIEGAVGQGVPEYGPGNPCNFVQGPLVKAIQDRLVANGYVIPESERALQTFGEYTCGAMDDYVAKNYPGRSWSGGNPSVLELVVFGTEGVCRAHFSTVREAECKLAMTTPPTTTPPAGTTPRSKKSWVPLLWIPVIGAAAWIFTGTLRPPR